MAADAGRELRHELGRLVTAWPTLWRVAAADMLAYRAEMVIWILSATMPLVMLALWDAAAAEGPLEGFGQADFARYFAVTLVVRQLTGAWIVWELNYNIRQGALSPQLLRPLNPLWFNLASTLAALPWRMLVLAPLLVGLWWWRPDVWFWPEPGRLAAFVLSVLLAFLLSWLVQCLMGLLAFWFEQSLGFFSVYFAVWALTSGYVVPLALLPAWLRGAFAWLPFYGTLGAPVGILTGAEAAPGSALLVQLAWVAALALATVFTWKRGIVRYGAVGA